jgi:hypothetical protein
MMVESTYLHRLMAPSILHTFFTRPDESIKTTTQRPTRFFCPYFPRHKKVPVFHFNCKICTRTWTLSPLQRCHFAVKMWHDSAIHSRVRILVLCDVCIFSMGFLDDLRWEGADHTTSNLVAGQDESLDVLSITSFLPLSEPGHKKREIVHTKRTSLRVVCGKRKSQSL